MFLSCQLYLQIANAGVLNSWSKAWEWVTPDFITTYDTTQIPTSINEYIYQVKLTIKQNSNVGSYVSAFQINNRGTPVPNTQDASD